MRGVPKLPRRPEARAFSVETLLQLVQDGKLRVPEFQRPQRWRSTHVLSLFDSVWRGFPIGEFLFSKGQAPQRLLRFGAVEVQAPEVPDAYLLHPDLRPRGDIHAIWFDLDWPSARRCASIRRRRTSSTAPRKRRCA